MENPHAPQTCASANSATLANMTIIYAVFAFVKMFFEYCGGFLREQYVRAGRCPPSDRRPAPDADALPENTAFHGFSAKTRCGQSQPMQQSRPHIPHACALVSVRERRSGARSHAPERHSRHHLGAGRPSSRFLDLNETDPAHKSQNPRPIPAICRHSRQEDGRNVRDFPALHGAGAAQQRSAFRDTLSSKS